LLLCSRTTINTASAYNVWRVDTAPTTDFVSVINGAPSGTSLTYGAVSAGSENCIEVSEATQHAKTVLWNTTKTPDEYALIASVNVGTNVITVTDADDISGWLNTEAITARSTYGSGEAPSGSYCFDVELTSSDIPELTVALILDLQVNDSAGAGRCYVIEYSTDAASKYIAVLAPNIGAASNSRRTAEVPIIARRFRVVGVASGVDTGGYIIRLKGFVVASA
jgi:hypothetical protein